MSTITITTLDPVHTDDRGSITDLINTTDPFHHIGMITFTEGAVRANHWHKLSDQYDYIVEGKVELATKEANNPDAKVETHILNAGDLAHIPKGIIHAYRALEPSSMIDVTTTSREGVGYEEDTIRVDSLFE
ncbi:cupin domain-containing protein [Candidatus Peregrinibacteria bacterium]|nr:cupin domain-containing protein [Candidatus Peregrinibacteria bacterium]